MSEKLKRKTRPKNYLRRGLLLAIAIVVLLYGCMFWSEMLFRFGHPGHGPTENQLTVTRLVEMNATVAVLLTQTAESR